MKRRTKQPAIVVEHARFGSMMTADELAAAMHADHVARFQQCADDARSDLETVRRFQQEAN